MSLTNFVLKEMVWTFWKHRNHGDQSGFIFPLFPSTSPYLTNTYSAITTFSAASEESSRFCMKLRRTSTSTSFSHTFPTVSPIPGQKHNNEKEEYCLKNFKSYYEVVKHSGGQVGQHPILIDQKLR